MALITLKGNSVSTIGNVPGPDVIAPSFTLTRTDLSETGLHDFKGKTVILNIFPSIDTSVCAASVRRFNEVAGSLKDTIVLCISADLPFAHNRFCEAEGLNNVIPLSSFRSQTFGSDYGLTITTGPLAGLLARAIIIIDKEGIIKYTELVPEITQEPNYSKALENI